MSAIGCYTLDLYCDNTEGAHGFNEFPHTFTGRTNTSCRNKARRSGWLFKTDGRTICPRCRKQQRRTK